MKDAQRGLKYSPAELMGPDVPSTAAQMDSVSCDGLRLAPTKRFSCCLQAHLVKFSLGGCIKEPEQNVRVCK